MVYNSGLSNKLMCLSLFDDLSFLICHNNNNNKKRMFNVINFISIT